MTQAKHGEAAVAREEADGEHVDVGWGTHPRGEAGADGRIRRCVTDAQVVDAMDAVDGLGPRAPRGTREGISLRAFPGARPAPTPRTGA